MKLVLPLLLLLPLASTGCRAPQSDPAPGATPACICGQPMADFEGCPHPLCLQGLRNPENPECVCGPLELEPDGGAK